jgi:hypothetical protein
MAYIYIIARMDTDVHFIFETPMQCMQSDLPATRPWIPIAMFVVAVLVLLGASVMPAREGRCINFMILLMHVVPVVIAMLTFNCLLRDECAEWKYVLGAMVLLWLVTAIAVSFRSQKATPAVGHEPPAPPVQYEPPMPPTQYEPPVPPVQYEPPMPPTQYEPPASVSIEYEEDAPAPHVYEPPTTAAVKDEPDVEREYIAPTTFGSVSSSHGSCGDTYAVWDSSNGP